MKTKIILFAIIIALIAVFWKANQERLNNYNDYYMCDIYNRQEYCK